VPLSPTIQHHLNAALGWLDLGNHVEAHNELERLPFDQRAMPEVLKLRCRIYRQAEKWDYLSMLAESCYSAHPQQAQFLIDWAWADYRQGRKERAAMILLHESGRFQESEALAYDLAIVLASLDRPRRRGIGWRRRSSCQRSRNWRRYGASSRACVFRLSRSVFAPLNKSSTMPGNRSKSAILGNTDFEYNLAIKQRSLPKLKTLLKYGIPPPKGCLIYPYQLGHADLLPILLDAGADPNHVGHRGWTIMGECILNSDVPTLKLLLSRKADPNRGFGGTPAIVQAARVGNIEVLSLLVDAGGSLFDDPLVAPHALFEAIARGYTDIVEYLLTKGVSCTGRKPFGKTALEWAAEKGTPEILALLRKRKRARKSA
jgi:hypothetical protein